MRRLQVWLHFILLYFPNCLYPFKDKTLLKSRKEKRNILHWIPRVLQGNTVTCNPWSTPDTGNSHLHFTGWESESAEEWTSFWHHKFPKWNLCLSLMSFFSLLYQASHLLPSRCLDITLFYHNVRLFLFISHRLIHALTTVVCLKQEILIFSKALSLYDL